MLGWCYKIINMNEQRLPKMLFKRFKQLDLTANNKNELNWCSQIKTFLELLGYEDVWQMETINKGKIIELMKHLKLLL